MNNLVSTIIAIALLIGAFFLGGIVMGGGCNSAHDSPARIDSTHTSDTSYAERKGFFNPEFGGFPPDTVYDSFTNVKVKYVDTGSTDTITRNDTHYVMLDYFRYRAYSRRFSDSNIRIDVELGVAKNRLQNFEVGYEFDEATVNSTTTITNTKMYRYKLWLTGSLNFNRANAGLELDFGKHKFGISRTMLSDTKLNEGEKWWVEYGFRIAEN